MHPTAPRVDYLAHDDDGSVRRCGDRTMAVLKHRSGWWRLAAYAFVVAAALFVVNEERKRADQKITAAQLVTDRKIATSAVAACERGNILRAELNANTVAVTRFLLDSAMTYELPRYQRPADTAFAHRRAGDYRHLAKTLNEIPLVDCATIVYQP